MSMQDGPYWYPSKQFVHSPPPPPGSQSASSPKDQPRWMQPDLVLWVVSAVASGVLALSCAVVVIVNAQDIPWANSVGGVNPGSLGSALIAATGVIVFGLISSTCTLACLVLSRTAPRSVRDIPG
jgi:hypothetical protein